MLKNFLLVGLGGALGSMLRYGAYMLVPAKNFPVATLAVNIIGSFLIGVILSFSIKDDNFLNSWKVFLATGICGGFTTFSAFSAENVALLQNGKYSMALMYTLISVVAGITAAWLGFKLINHN